MNDSAVIIFLLLLMIAALLVVILYQQFAFRTGTGGKLRQISEKLKEITDSGSDEKIFVFTDNKEMMELAAQINRLLEEHLKVKADYRRSEITAKKMLSNISHDIKTPMTVILGYLEIMRLNRTQADSVRADGTQADSVRADGTQAGSIRADGTQTSSVQADGTQADSAQEEEMLLKTEQKAKDVMELINQFFTLAKLESGDMAPELTRIDVCEICRKSILDFYELLTDREFQVDVDLPEASVYVQGNAESVERILYNLISNVIRYGADGKYLGLSLRTDEKAVYIDVTDKGKGIDASFADHVFDRLFTMEDSRNREIQGNGLGLTIARDLAMQMGGGITLESVPGRRTTFTVRLRKIIY